MRMNVQPIPTVPERINEIRNLTATIINKEILPHENMLWTWRDGGRFSDAEIEEARGHGLRSALHQDERSPRRRRMGNQRPQVVHLQRQARRLLHRHVPHRRP